jgi:hypothetical protein
MRSLIIAAVSVALLAGCAQSVPGRAGESPRLDPLKVAGLPITSSASGVRPDATPADRKAQNTDGGRIDALATSEDLVAWDRGELLPSLDDISVVAVIAHELGHAVGFRLGVDGNAPSIVKEQQADCYAGNYFRWVAEGKSKRFQVSTGTGVNQILATLVAIRDSAGSGFDSDGAHGTAFDRVTAFQFGFAGSKVRWDPVCKATAPA